MHGFAPVGIPSACRAVGDVIAAASRNARRNPIAHFRLNPADAIPAQADLRWKCRVMARVFGVQPVVDCRAG